MGDKKSEVTGPTGAASVHASQIWVPSIPQDLEYQMPVSGRAIIGSFLVDWNEMELKVDAVVFSVLAVSSDELDAIMGSPNVSPRADIMAAVCRQRYELTKPDLHMTAVECSKQIKGMSGFRNGVAHGRWALNTDDPKRTFVSARRGLLSGPTVTLEQVASKLTEVRRLLNKVSDLHWRIMNFGHKGPNPNPWTLPSPWHGKF